MPALLKEYPHLNVPQFTVSEFISKRRTFKISQKRLAELMGISPTTLQKIEKSNKKSMIKREYALSIIALLPMLSECVEKETVIYKPCEYTNIRGFFARNDIVNNLYAVHVSSLEEYMSAGLPLSGLIYNQFYVNDFGELVLIKDSELLDSPPFEFKFAKCLSKDEIVNQLFHGGVTTRKLERYNLSYDLILPFLDKSKHIGYNT